MYKRQYKKDLREEPSSVGTLEYISKLGKKISEEYKIDRSYRSAKTLA